LTCIEKISLYNWRKRRQLTQILPHNCVTQYIIGKWTISHWRRRTSKNRHDGSEDEREIGKKVLYFRLEEKRWEGGKIRSEVEREWQISKVERYIINGRGGMSRRHIIFSLKCHGTWSLFYITIPSAASPCFGCVFPPIFKKIPVASQTHTHTSLPCHEVILNKCLINIWINRTWKECFCSSSSHHYQTKQKNYY
jgi:hypothetical protein